MRNKNPKTKKKKKNNNNNNKKKATKKDLCEIKTQKLKK